MRFIEFTEDERREWRESDITRAFLERVREQMAAEIDGVLYAGRSALPGAESMCHLHTGRHDGLRLMIEIAMLTEKK